MLATKHCPLKTNDLSLLSSVSAAAMLNAETQQVLSDPMTIPSLLTSKQHQQDPKTSKISSNSVFQLAFLESLSNGVVIVAKTDTVAKTTSTKSDPGGALSLKRQGTPATALISTAANHAISALQAGETAGTVESSEKKKKVKKTKKKHDNDIEQDDPNAGKQKDDDNNDDDKDQDDKNDADESKKTGGASDNDNDNDKGDNDGDDDDCGGDDDDEGKTKSSSSSSSSDSSSGSL